MVRVDSVGGPSRRVTAASPSIGQLIMVHDDPLALSDVGVLLVVHLEDALDHDERETAEKGSLQL